MDTARDLARVDPWRESLERSRARRRKPPDHTSEPEPRREHDDRHPARELPSYRRLCWQAIGSRRAVLVVAVVLFALAVLAATRSGAPVRLAVRPTATARQSPPAGLVAAAQPADPCRVAATIGRIAGREANTRRPGAGSTGYVNPLAGATVTSERIDQGVDYAGSGPLGAIGSARVMYIATSDTGWPGTFIEYQLLRGPESGCYVYYAEGVTPAPGLHIGEALRPGQTVATIIPHYSSGIEIGWGAGRGTKTYAAKLGEWTPIRDEDSMPSAAGESFSALIVSLGGPPGKIEG